MSPSSSSPLSQRLRSIDIPTQSERELSTYTDSFTSPISESSDLEHGLLGSKDQVRETPVFAKQKSPWAKPKNAWTYPQKEILCCLFKFYEDEDSHKTYAKVFSHIFARDLKRCGFDGDIPGTTLNSYWHQMIKDRASVVYQIHVVTLLSDVKGKFKHLKDRIEETAESLSVQLKKKTWEDLAWADEIDWEAKPTLVKQQSRKRGKSEQVLGDAYPESQGSENEQTPEISPKRRRVPKKKAAANSFGHSLKKRVGKGSTKPAKGTRQPPKTLKQREPREGIPYLAYRFFHDQSFGENSLQGFRAGLFANTPISDPPNIDSPDMRAHARAHLTPLKKATPFVSTPR